MSQAKVQQPEAISIGPSSRKQEMFLNSKAVVTCAGGAAGCFDKDTQYLTETGWKFFDEYQGEKIAQYNSGTDSLEFVHPEEYIKLPCEEFKRINQLGFDFCLSPEHRVPSWEMSNTPNIETFAEFCANYEKGKHYSIKVGFNAPESDFRLTQEQLEEIVRNPLKEIPVEYWKIGKEQAQVLTKMLHCSYVSEHKTNADFIQYVLHATGRGSFFAQDLESLKYMVSCAFTDNGFRSAHSTFGSIQEYKSLDGFKYCFTVPTGLLVVRRSNKIFISGNSGKSFTSLLIALKHMQHPRATGVIFRRTSKMLTAPGSIWHEACALFSSIYPKGLRIKSRELEIVFPHGALLKFSHCQYDSNMYDHKGAQYSLVIFDESCDFPEEVIVYLMSRMRNANVDYPPQMYLMTNPDYNSFLRVWLQDYYLDNKGIPIPERAGHVRYFFRQSNTVLWYNTLEEAEAVHGSGPQSGITSFAFIGATVQDNPHLLKAQPDYISRLMSLPRVEMERLLLGSWFARQESSGLFKREWCEMVSYPDSSKCKRVRSWDFAFSLPSEAYPNPDYTAGVLISKNMSNVYTVEDVVRMRNRVHEVEKLIFTTAIRDGRGVTISIPQDPNAAAGAYAKDLQRRLGEMGFSCRLSRPVQSKITRFAPFSSISQAGFIRVVIADWNKDFFEELEIFNGEKKHKDDQVDACSDCMFHLNREVQMPNIRMMDLNSIVPSHEPTSGFPAFNNKEYVEIPEFNVKG